MTINSRADVLEIKLWKSTKSKIQIDKWCSRDMTAPKTERLSLGEGQYRVAKYFAGERGSHWHPQSCHIKSSKEQEEKKLSEGQGYIKLVLPTNMSSLCSQVMISKETEKIKFLCGWCQFKGNRVKQIVSAMVSEKQSILGLRRMPMAS